MGSACSTWSSTTHVFTADSMLSSTFSQSGGQPQPGKRLRRPPVGRSHSPDWQWVGHLLGMPAAVCRSHGTLLRTRCAQQPEVRSTSLRCRTLPHCPCPEPRTSPAASSHSRTALSLSHSISRRLATASHRSRRVWKSDHPKRRRGARVLHPLNAPHAAAISLPEKAAGAPAAACRHSACPTTQGPLARCGTCSHPTPLTPLAHSNGSAPQQPQP